MITLECELLRSTSTKCTSKITEDSDVSEINTASNISSPDNESQFIRYPSTSPIAVLNQISEPSTSKSNLSLSTTSPGAFCYLCNWDLELCGKFDTLTPRVVTLSKIFRLFLILDISQIVELLTEIGFENISEVFIKNDFTIEGLMAIEKSDLIALGLSIGLAQQFLLSLQKYKKKPQTDKDEERKRRLKLVLEEIERLDLLDTFIENKILHKDIRHLSVDDLAKMGVLYGKRKEWSKSLAKINCK